MRTNRPIVALLLGMALSCAASSTAAAQGLREEARGLLESLTLPGGDACAQLVIARGLLERIAGSEAEPFMTDEVARLSGALDELATRCQVQTAARESSDAQRQSLLQRCVGLGQARAFCLLLDECAPVRQLTRRMRDFWDSAQEGCVR